MSRTWDAVIVGGGHNGLVAGFYLARAGLSTLMACGQWFNLSTVRTRVAGATIGGSHRV